MAALVAAMLVQIGDRPARLAAILADRYRSPAIVLAAAAAALALATGLAAAGGALLAPGLTANARQLLLAVALLLQGAGAFWPVQPPDRLAGWRLGAWGTSFAGLLTLVFGDGLMLVVLALAARSVPALAAIGAVLGSLAVLAAAALLGEAAWLRLPLTALRRAAGTLFLLAGIILALGALRLV